MIRCFPLLLAGLMYYGYSHAQKLLSRSAIVEFHSDSPLEQIRAVNKQGLFVLDQAAMRIESAVLMKGFQFRKALMQEHFNENYVESDKYPRGSFKGSYSGETIDWDKDGTYEIIVEGIMTIHGVSNPVRTNAKFIIANKNISANATFFIKLSDYKIKIPALVADNINNNVKITIETGALEKQ